MFYGLRKYSQVYHLFLLMQLFAPYATESIDDFSLLLFLPVGCLFCFFPCLIGSPFFHSGSSSVVLFPWAQTLLFLVSIVSYRHQCFSNFDFIKLGLLTLSKPIFISGNRWFILTSMVGPTRNSTSITLTTNEAHKPATLQQHYLVMDDINHIHIIRYLVHLLQFRTVSLTFEVGG